MNFFIINNFLDQFRIYHRRGQDLNFKNMSLSIFSLTNSISYTASKTGVSFMPFWPLSIYKKNKKDESVIIELCSV